MFSQFWQQPSHLLALKTKSREILYGELQEAVLRWMSYLSLQKGESVRNGILFQDSFHTDACILAHLFSGKTFVPFHMNWSEKVKKDLVRKLQLQAVFDDTKAKEVLSIRPISGSQFFEFPKSGLMSLFMTSGSTGISKAVGVDFQNFSALLPFLYSSYPLSKGTPVAQCFLPSFDPYYAMMALAYGQGASLIMLNRDDHFQLDLFCKKNEIEFFASVPTLVELNFQRKFDSCPKIKKTLFTGESLKAETVKKWHQFAPHSTIENLYGPVETTVWVTRYQVDLDNPLPKNIPIGQPIHQNQLSIENENLVIRGPQVTKGYWHNSNWEFFNGEFRTKDRVENNELGEFIFLGRDQSILKISGERVDLEQIENELYNCFQIICLLVWSEKNKGLNLVIQGDENIEKIVEYIETDLPVRFHLKSIQRLKEWPITISGKRDRREVARLIEERL
jgi:acyl-coenzyme A synthetase/AMP-(fatty) acid ligase